MIFVKTNIKNLKMQANFIAIENIFIYICRNTFNIHNYGEKENSKSGNST